MALITTLRFNDEEQREAKMAIHAHELYCGLWNTQEELRQILKYRDDLELTDKQNEALLKIMVDIGERLSMVEE